MPLVVRVRLLGRFAVEVDGAAVPDGAWSRRDAVALVKVLALAPEHRLHREQVLDHLWPDVPPDEAAPRLHKAAHYARRAIGHQDAVRLRDDIVALSPDVDVIVDAVELERQGAAALVDGAPAVAAQVLDRWRGEPLPEDLYAEWAAEPRARLTALRERLLRQARRWDELLLLDPTDEDAYVAAMRDTAAAGDLHGVLRHYESLDRALQRELGISPGAAAVAARDQALSALRSGGALTSADAARVDQEIRFCRTSDGVTLAYAASGTGPPLVKAANWLTHLDHDWHSTVWRHWLLQLSAGNRLIRYDERGCGLSDWELPATTFDDWVRDLECVVDAAGLERFPLLGISQGGPVAITYAARHPERVSRLVLYGTYVQGRLVRATSEEHRREHAMQVELARLGWGRDDPAFRQVFTSQFMPEGSRALWDEFNALQRLTSPAANAARALEITGGIDVTEQAREVRAPTLVLHARDDARPPFEQGRLAASLIPGSRFVALDSRNHILLADEPAWGVFVREASAFLAEA